MEPLLLLHGAIGASAQLTPLADALARNYRVYTLNFSGHGGVGLPHGPLSIELFAHEVLRFLDEHQIEQISIFGYSMGGYVAMYLARYHPHRIKKVVTLATKYSWDEAIAAREVRMLDPEKTAEKVPEFATSLRQLHHPVDWKLVMVRTAEMMLAMGRDNPLKPLDYPLITHPVLLLLGDRDKMVSLEETLAVYKALPQAQLGILPATPHPIGAADCGLLSSLIIRFVG